MSVAEQRYKAVMAVISEGRTITQVARDWGVSRQTMHAWLARYESNGLEGLANLSHRPSHCPHQMAVTVEVQLLEMRRAKPYWGARRLGIGTDAQGCAAGAIQVCRLPLPGSSWGHRPIAEAAAQ